MSRGSVGRIYLSRVGAVPGSPAEVAGWGKILDTESSEIRCILKKINIYVQPKHLYVEKNDYPIIWGLTTSGEKVSMVCRIFNV